MSKTRVLFICTGNSARSQMAEAFLRTYGGDLYEPFSAGLEPRGVNPLTVRVMEERGIDLASQHSKGLAEYLGRQHFGILITVCDRAERECPVFPGVATRLHWSFEDPAATTGSEAQRLAKFREVRDQIEVRVREWLEDRSSSASSASETA
ncbi:MAG: arsenate reductase ArsC [Thermoleophilia bacterium]